MKQISQILTGIFLLIGVLGQSQITLNTCHPLLENQDYIFNEKSTDITGRNIFETNPVDGNQPCSGIGSCEFQIAWNNNSSRWEIYADDGNGDFSNTYLLYYNAEASLPNPPSLNLGSWIEETTVTQSLCGTIVSLSGDVQDTTLGIIQLTSLKGLNVYPNPATNVIHISNASLINQVVIYNILGELVLHRTESFSAINISKLNSGVYFLKAFNEDDFLIKKIIIK